jgi:hypothetical protein
MNKTMHQPETKRPVGQNGPALRAAEAVLVLVTLLVKKGATHAS